MACASGTRLLLMWRGCAAKVPHAAECQLVPRRKVCATCWWHQRRPLGCCSGRTQRHRTAAGTLSSAAGWLRAPRWTAPTECCRSRLQVQGLHTRLSARHRRQAKPKQQVWQHGVLVTGRRRAVCGPMKTMEGCISVATAKRVRTSFSPSPCHLDVSEEADMLKKVAFASAASALASSVLPLPGGPYSSSPRAGARSPRNRSARSAGRITISCSACAAGWLH